MKIYKAITRVGMAHGSRCETSLILAFDLTDAISKLTEHYYKFPHLVVSVTSVTDISEGSVVIATGEYATLSHEHFK